MAASAERVTGATPQSRYSDLDRMLIGASWRHGRSNSRVRDKWVTVQHEPRVFPIRASEVGGGVSAGG